MEIVSRPFNGKNYWRKNGYALLDGAAAKRRSIQVVRISGSGSGGGAEDGQKRKWLWRLRKAPKVVMAVTRPKRIWQKLRDGYVNMMMRMAGEVGRLKGGNELMGKRIAPARKARVPTKQRMEDFETRLVVEIYKAMSTSRGLSEL